MEESTAEFTAEQLVPSVELRVRPRVTVAAKTDLGRVRENNEDKYEFFISEDAGQLATRGLIFLVCDGMGGHAAGQIASELACKTFIDVYLHHPSTEPVPAMSSGVVAANRFVMDNSRAFPDRRGMGTTLSGLVLLQDQAYTIQVGDSRVYRLRGDELVQLTHDHTWVEEALRQGVLAPEEADTHPYKHVLTRAIGAEDAVNPEIESHDLQEGDLYLLCSDGLINHVGDFAIGQALRSFSPAEAVWRLIGQALQGGGSDNTTVMVVRVDALEMCVSTSPTSV
ncbi:MAG TPA: PP2C family serine/threonine-protein phosphatase [Fimbriimonas sp.]|nr:PP2C family serine/threonine-protein phosphatase [Fimbriimonas sp.]